MLLPGAVGVDTAAALVGVAAATNGVAAVIVVIAGFLVVDVVDLQSLFSFALLPLPWHDGRLPLFLLCCSRPCCSTCFVIELMLFLSW